MEQILNLAHHYFIPFILVISVVVFVHEFGHYYVARLCGVKIEAFSIGFGPEICGWNDKHGTRWRVALLPLGGYVKMYGDADPASTPDDKVHTMTEEEKRVSFFHQSVNKRLAVVVAGPATNYIFAILVLSLLFIFQGQPYSPPIIGGMLENSAAAKAGLQIGDRITQLDNTTINRFEDIKRTIALNPGIPVTVHIERQGQALDMTLTPEIVVIADRVGGEHKMGRIGITTDKLDYKKWSPPLAVMHAAIETWDLSTSALKAMGQMIVGLRSTDDLGGPLRIAKMSGEIAQDGMVALVWFMAVISVNLGLINLFPVPMLDGGHIAFYLWERVRGRPAHKHVQEVGIRVGMILVFSLMIFSTWNDLVNLKVISYLRSLFS